ncbi:SGNH/GDSL hydrolase family protein [Klebsiella pneumoniae]|nr:SGNH/GDSL hydrolase family protein [Klebsiella pneumoniae]
MATTDTQQAAQFSAEAAVSAAEAKQYLIEAQQGYQDTSAAAQEAKDAAAAAATSEQNATYSEANAAQSAAAAVDAKADAEAAASSASDYAKNKFTFYKTASDPDGTIAGLAATTDGQSFWVAQGPDALSAAWQYQNKAGVAVLQAKQPGTAAITGTIREFPTLAAAQADADAGNIPVGSTAYYRSPDDSALAVEVINNAGTLQPTGRKMPSQSSVDNVRSAIGTAAGEVLARESIFADIEKTGNWTRTDTSQWAVGVVSDGLVLNFIDLWLDNISGINRVNVKVYARSADGANVFPGAPTDTLLSSTDITAADLGITNALASGYQLARMMVPPVSIPLGVIALFVVTGLNSSGGRAYIGCGRADITPSEAAGLINSQGGFWNSVSDAGWKVTTNTTDSLYRLAYRVGFFSSAAEKEQAFIASKTQIASAPGNRPDLYRVGSTLNTQWYAWALGFNGVSSAFDVISLYHQNLSAVSRVDYRVVIRAIGNASAKIPLGKMDTDREVYSGSINPPAGDITSFTEVDYPVPGLIIPPGYFAAIEIHAFDASGAIANIGCQAHDYAGGAVPTDIGLGYFVNRIANAWNVIADTKGLAYKLSKAVWETAESRLAHLSDSIQSTSADMATVSTTVSAMNTYETEKLFEKSSDSLRWSYSTMAESMRFWRWAVPISEEASKLQSVAMWLDGVSLNTIIQCDVYLRLKTDETSTSGPGVLPGDIIAFTGNVTPLPTDTSMTKITLPIDSLVVPDGYFPIVAVTAYYSAGVSGNLGSGSKSYSAGDNPAMYQKGWYSRFDRAGWASIDNGAYAAIAVSAVLVTTQDLQEKIASLESGSDEAADYSGDSIDRYAPHVAATGLTAAITGNAIIRGSAKPISGTLTFDSTTVGSKTVASSLVPTSGSVQWPSNPNAWLGEKRISNVTVTNTATGTALTPVTHYNVDSYGGKLRGLTATTYAVSVAFTYTRERYDLIQIDPTSLVMSVKKGTERAFDVQEYRPAPDAGKVALYYVLVAGNTLEFDPVHRYVDLGGEMLDGKDYGLLRQHNRRNLQKTLARLNRGQAITLVGHGDSITAVSNINSPATTPNGTTRDLQRFLQGGYGSDTLTNLYPAQDWGDGGGAIHVSIGWNRVLKKYFEDVFGSVVTYYNFGMSGTTSASGAGSDRLGAITALSPHLTVVGFGMNDNAGSTLYGNLMTIINTLKAAGSEVVLMPVPRTSNTEDGRYTQDQTRYMNRQVYRAAIDGGAAYAPADWLTDDNSKGGMGIATTSLTGSDLRNHPGGYEMSIYGKALVNVFC